MLDADSKMLQQLQEDFEKFLKEWNGTGDELGIKTKIQIMWRGHIILFCAVSAIIGWVSRAFFDKLLK